MKELPDLPQYFQSQAEFIKFIKPIFITDFGFPTSSGICSSLFRNRSWQLSRNGRLFLSLHYKTYKSINTENYLITGKMLLQSNRLINGPWAINSNIIYLWRHLLNSGCNSHSVP